MDIEGAGRYCQTSAPLDLIDRIRVTELGLPLESKPRAQVIQGASRDHLDQRGSQPPHLLAPVARTPPQDELPGLNRDDIAAKLKYVDRFQQMNDEYETQTL